MSIRFVEWTAALLGLVMLGSMAASMVTLQRQLGQAVDTIDDLRSQTASQHHELTTLRDQLGGVDRDLRHVRADGEEARREVLAAMELGRAGEAGAAAVRAELTAELADLETRVGGMRSAWETEVRERAASGAEEDVEARARQLMCPTVRLGGVHEVGSGTVLWSRVTGGQALSYVLTAWHIFKDDPQGTELDVDVFVDGRRLRTDRGRIVARNERLDLALVEVRGRRVYEHLARLPRPAELARMPVFTPVYAIGCPLGYPPLPTRGEITSRGRELDGVEYWMVNAPTIFGNSGGGIYQADDPRLMIGVLSRISAYKNMIDVAVPHMGLVTPLGRVYEWLDGTAYAFVYRDRLSEAAPGALPASVPAEAVAGEPRSSERE